MMRQLGMIFLAATLLALGTATAATAQAQERCYGVARAGTADGIDGEERPGSGTVDYQGNAWIWVPAGTCLTRTAPVQADGTPRRGALEPLSRDLP